MTYSTDSNGTITGTNPQIVAESRNGTPVTPTPNPGYHFVNWSDSSTENPRTDTNVIADITVTANFAINPSYTLTVINGSGGGTVVEGQSAVISADAPATGFHFVNWTTSNGGSFANANSVTTNYTMPGNNSTVTANFAINSYTVTYNTGGNGSITGINPQTIDHDSNGTAVTATPSIGYHFVNWGDGSTNNPRIETNIITDKTVTANFAINQYTLTYNATENGYITGINPQAVDHNYDGTTVTAIPDVGYHFVNWSDDSTDNPRTDLNVTSDISITANFNQPIYVKFDAFQI